MSAKWWEESWNPVVGCTPASPGCDNCYAKRLHDQRHAAHVDGKDVPACYARSFEWVIILPDRLKQPLHWRKPRRIFVNSMSDLFHPAVPFEFLDRVFAVMARCPQHTFMVLTKRPERMREYVLGTIARGMTWREGVTGRLPSNVWLGVTAEDQAMADARIPILLDTPAAKRFVSIEPMLGPVDLPWLRHGFLDPAFYNVLDWVICGGETGPKARSMAFSSPRDLRDQCADAGVPFFFKQWGDYRCCPASPRYRDRLLDGREHNDMPEIKS